MIWSRVRWWTAGVIVLGVLVTAGTAVRGAFEQPSREVSRRGPAQDGIFISAEELASVPTDGNPAWEDLLERVDTELDDVELSIEVDSDGPMLVYGAGLIWARAHARLPQDWTDADALRYRRTAAERLADVVALPLDDEETVTRPARRIGAYVLAADLIDLRDFDAALDVRFRAWLLRALHLRREDGLLHSVWDSALYGVGNTAFAARFSAVVAARYLGDERALEQLWTSWCRIFDNSVDHDFVWATGDAHGSWQNDPEEQNTDGWYGVLPATVRDGHDVGGVIPADIRRTNDEPGMPADRFNYYDADDFPGGMYSNYNHLSVDALLLTAEVLQRAGYPAKSFGDRGPLRAAAMIRRFAQRHGEGSGERYPWRYFDVSSRYEQLVHLINAMYPDVDFPSVGDCQRPTHLLGFLTFTHGDPRAGASADPRSQQCE